MKKVPFIAALAIVLAMSANAAAAIDTAAANALMTTAGCGACHQPEKKVLGPAYKEVSGKYKGNAKASDLLMQKIRNGGAGTWGAIPMPPNPKEKISDVDLKNLVGWILSL